MEPRTLSREQVDALSIEEVTVIHSGGSSFPVEGELPIADYIDALFGDNTSGVEFKLVGTELSITQASAGTKG